MLVPHQANLRIAETVQRSLGLRDDQVFNNIQKYGNTTAASIPLALAEAIPARGVKRGDLVALAAFGAGFTWGAALREVVMPRKAIEASSNGRTADFGSAYEGSNPSASARPAARATNQRAEVKTLPLPERFLLAPIGPLPKGLLAGISAALQEVFGPRRRARAPQVKPEFAFNKDRRQYHSTAVLRRLEGLRRPGGTRRCWAWSTWTSSSPTSPSSSARPTGTPAARW